MTSKEREDTYEAPHSKAAAARTEDAKNGGKEVARPKDEVGPYVPDKRSYFAGLALTGIMANAALHRAPNAAALAVKAGDDMLDELAKPPPPTDEELSQQARLKSEAAAKQQREQRAAEAEAEAKVAKEREEAEAKERDKLEKQGARELDKPGARNEREHARPM